MGDTMQTNTDGSTKWGETITSQDKQCITVSQLVPPKICTHVAQDIPGQGNDVTIFFVMKKELFLQFLPAFDVELEGICMGEGGGRQLIIPPVLAYGSQGLPRRGILPNTAIQYDVQKK
eukprot:14128484-Ditylum_brightwellii.AAC.1